MYVCLPACIPARVCVCVCACFDMTARNMHTYVCMDGCMCVTSVAFVGVPLETHSSAGRCSTRRFAAQRNGHAQDARGLPAAAACAAACTCRQLARGRAWGGRSSPRGADARGTGASGAGARRSEARGGCGGAAACAPGQEGPDLTAKVNAGGQRGIWEARERQAVQRSCNGRFCCSNTRRMCQQGRSNVSTPRSALRPDKGTPRTYGI